MTQIAYCPVHKESSLVLGTNSHIFAPILVAGWYPIKALKKQLDPNTYSAIGSLYSKKSGINFLLRNLISNPHIRTVVAISITEEDKKSRSIDCLEDLILNGYYECSDGCNEAVVKRLYIRLRDNSLNPVSLDSNIPKIYIDGLIENISFKRFYSLENLKTWLTENNLQQESCKESGTWHENPGIKFPFDQEKQRDRIPLSPGQVIRASGLKDAWIKAVDLAMKGGIDRSTRHGGSIRELIDLVTVLDTDNIYQDIKEDDCIPFAQDELDSYVREALDFSDQESVVDVSYTYSDRISSYFGINQIRTVIERLTSDEDNSAIVTLWDVGHDNDSTEPPCLNHLNFRVQEGELYLTATFRSHDIFSAFYLNIASLLDLQEKVAEALSMSRGSLIVASQSAHIYEDRYVEAQEIVDKCKLKQIKYLESNLNFIINLIDSDVIEVVCQSQENTLKTYSGKNIVKLYKEIGDDLPALAVDHAMYLGCELQKAEIAIAQNLDYIQDKKFRTFDFKSE